MVSFKGIGAVRMATAGVLAATLLAGSATLSTSVSADGGDVSVVGSRSEILIDGYGDGIAGVQVATPTQDLGALLDAAEPPLLRDFTPNPDTSLSGSSSLSRSVSPSARPGVIGSSSFRAAPSCSSQCIVEAKAEGFGTGAAITVKTDVDARISITVWNSEGNKIYSPSGEKFFRAFFWHLKGDTFYNVTVRATDAYGHTSAASGSFKTLRRDVSVTFGNSRSGGHDAHILGSSHYTGEPIYVHLWEEGEWLRLWESGPFYPTPVTGEPYSIIDFSHAVSVPGYLVFYDLDRYFDLQLQFAQMNPDGGGRKGLFDKPDCVTSIQLAEPSMASTPGCIVRTSVSLANAGMDDLDRGLNPSDKTTWSGYTLEVSLTVPPAYGPGGYVTPSLDVAAYATLEVSFVR